MPKDLNRLDGQVALVTGANSGIGRASAVALGAAGAAVVVNYVTRPEEADEVVAEIEAAGSRAVALRADVSQEDQVEAMFQQAVDTFGTLDILVNNAGIQRDAAFVEMTLDQWNAVMGVNLTGQFLCARTACRQFLRQGVREEISCAAGKIVCMNSVHQEIAWAGHANYAASKGGLLLLMESIAQELADQRVRVNGIAPGAIKTPLNRHAWEKPADERKLLKLIPYGRVGTPEDVARAVVWLSSDASDYVTGETLFVDGGMTLYPGFSTGEG